VDVFLKYQTHTIEHSDGIFCSRNLFLELLPQVGTGDSVLFTINLVKDRRISDWAATQMLIALPFYLQPHALFKSSPEEMLAACEVSFRS